MKIGIIGCGNLGVSLLEGVLSEMPDIEVYASKRDVSSIAHYASKKVTVTDDNQVVIAHCDVLIFALKPYTVLPFIHEHREFLDPKRHTLVSVATGITMSQILEASGNNYGVYRAMPNTAAAVNESMTALSSNEDPLNRAAFVQEIFNGLGTTVHIDESLMNAATILGACGVAYVLRFMRAMIQGGIEVGFDAKTATQIVSQTMKGASELILQNGSHPEQEIDKVTTPKGCTIVGLNEMEHSGFSSSLIKGITASYEKINKE
ncbi:MAG: pyrroline-5-carboxylate reductase [bacterium]|nr:pyrroline-5-carboxylate reductase [bacterium]